MSIMPDGDKLHELSLFVFKGNLAFITYGYPENDDGELSDSQCFIWVMRDYSVHESWNNLFSIWSENFDISFYGELLLDKKVKEESSNDDIKIHYCNESMILSNDPETLHEKDLGILQYVTHVVTMLRESLVLLDEGTELFG